MAANPVYCAIDTTDVTQAAALAAELAGAVGGIKLGMEFFYAHGPAGYRGVAASGLPLFLDLKLHDIPNTVAGAVRAVAPLAPAILTVHAAGGSAMLRAAAETAADQAARLGVAKPAVVAVTVLTSLDQADLTAIGVAGAVGDQVRRLAVLARESGLDGIVCSPQEIALVRAECGPDFKLVVPGIRPAGAELGDQKRVMTPRDAMQAGATWLVIGRPITQAADPVAAARDIAATLA